MNSVHGAWNDTAQQEIEALMAIYGDDFLSWKADSVETWIKLRLISHGDELKGLVVVFCIRFPEGYPTVLPKFNFKKEAGLSDLHVEELYKVVQVNSERFVGQEMLEVDETRLAEQLLKEFGRKDALVRVERERRKKQPTLAGNTDISENKQADLKTPFLRRHKFSINNIMHRHLFSTRDGCFGGTLFDAMRLAGVIDLTHLRHHSRRLLSTIARLHSAGVVHQMKVEMLSGNVSSEGKPNWRKIPSALALLISEMMAQDPDKRPTAKSASRTPVFCNGSLPAQFSGPFSATDPTEFSESPVDTPPQLAIQLGSAPHAHQDHFTGGLFDRSNRYSRYTTDFDEFEQLGRGGFGQVVKARNCLDGAFYAIKKIRVNPKDQERSDRLLREVQTLSRLHNEYVVRYFQAWLEEAPSQTSCDTTLSYDSLDESDFDDEDLSTSDDDDDDSAIDFRQDWLESTDMSHSIFSSKVSRQSDSVDTVSKNHASRSRDKRNRNVKIGDFGLATARRDATISVRNPIDLLNSVDDVSLTSEIGTPVYVAPEILVKAGRYNSKVDMYSLGILFFEMIYPLPTGMQRALVLRDLRLSSIVFPKDFDYNALEHQSEIIKTLLNHTPKERPSCLQLLQSPLVPTQVEEELITSLLGQRVDKHKDLAYDFHSALPALDIRNATITSYAERHVMGVFSCHGAVSLSSPLIVPKTNDIDTIYASKRPAELIDSSGNVVQVLTTRFDRTFARMISRMSLPLNLPLKR
ncbi:hypothetical protein BSLG_002452, partial [Batrachochytrium salamandrivorans]